MVDNIFENVHGTRETNLSKKLTFDGITNAFQVYKVKLDNLYFNDKNDRIATYISKYKIENGIDEFNFDDKETYNQIIEKFIIESNESAYKKTMNNIKLVEQREPAVILRDGRVIDGNRRFSCLRTLSKEDDKFKYIEAVILDRDIKESSKEIKLLELQLQHGHEERVGYNPIDKLVGLYTQVIVNNIITDEEYSKNTGENITKVRKEISKATLMAEFLDFLNSSRQFHIARDLELDGSLGEISNVLKKVKGDDAKDDMKNIIFTSMALSPEGDMTRHIRSFSKIANSEYIDEFIKENMAHTEEFLEEVDSHDVITTEVIRNNLRNNKQLIEKISDTYEKFDNKTKINESLNTPKNQILKAKNAVDNIDKKLLEKLDIALLNEFMDSLSDLEISIEEIKSSFDSK